MKVSRRWKRAGLPERQWTCAGPAFWRGAEIPFNMLEGSFLNLSAGQASVAYAESLAAAEYLRDSYGMSDIARILERLSQGSSTEAALRATVHLDYRQLRDEMTRGLRERYGR